MKSESLVIADQHAAVVNFVKEGYIAVAVDNPAAGEASDLERYTLGSNYDYR